MKKTIILGFAMLALFALMINVYADDANEQDDANETISLDTNNSDIQETDINATGKFGSTQFAMKIKLIHLMNVIDLKITQTEFILEKIEDNNLTIDKNVIETELENLKEIKSRIQVTLEDTYKTKEELLEVFLTEKENAKKSIKNIREYLRDNLPQELKNEFKRTFQAQKKELKPEFQKRVRELKDKHNEFIRNKFRDMLGKVKTEFKDRVTENKEELKREFKEQVREAKEKAEINQKLVTRGIVQKVRANGGNNR